MSQNKLFRRSLDYMQQKIQEILSTVSAGDLQRLYKLFFAADRIFVYGAGRSGLVSKAFAIRLVHLGFQTFVIGETIGAPVRKGDLVFIVSGSGETIPSVMTAEIAKKLDAQLIVVTSKQHSRITKFADIAIILSTECDDAERSIFAPLGTLFEASAWILFDSIIAELMEQKGETEQSMRLRHATLELP